MSVTLPDASETAVGGIANYYGRLSVKAEAGKAFWSIEDWDGHNWEEVPVSLYRALIRFERLRLKASQAPATTHP